ncbi:MAG: 50S ribosomal protein L19 [Candidatus Omnitrophica bacterium]|nr:50S ribosomal protein L19 [Candidatus Omnitrophota bacterium]
MEILEGLQIKKDIPEFNVGDTIRVFVKIVEAEKTRTQAFEGIVIGKKGSGLRETFTVRRISYGEGVERIFPLHSPSIERIVRVKEGKVRRAKLYYMRGKIGKGSKVEEKREFETIGQEPETANESAPAVQESIKAF